MRPKDAVISTWFEGGGVSGAREKGEGSCALGQQQGDKVSETTYIPVSESFFLRRYRVHRYVQRGT